MWAVGCERHSKQAKSGCLLGCSQVNEIRKQLTVRALQLEMQLIYMAIEAELLLANSIRKPCPPHNPDQSALRPL